MVDCCNDPLTGFFRDGQCNTCKEDFGMHTVCVLITEDFLIFSKSVGNDLSTPNTMHNFKGLKPGDNGVYVRLDGSKHMTRVLLHLSIWNQHT